MYDLLKSLGFNEKEAAIYLYLVNNGLHTASNISKGVKESRTNTYMVLDKLVAKGLIKTDDDLPVRRFGAEDPSRLHSQLKEKQMEVAHTKQALESALPDLMAAFNLGNHSTGVVSLVGVDGLRAAMEDMAKSKTELLLWGSHVADRDPVNWKIIENGGYKRRAKGITTRALFQVGASTWPHLGNFKNKGFEIRMWGQKPFMGEVVIYDNKVAITSYEPSVVITILTNEVIADTFRVIFENAWSEAVKIREG